MKYSPALSILFYSTSLYLTLGLLAITLTRDRRVRLAAIIIVFFGWPWFVWNEGTPKMARFISWAKKK